MIYEIIYDAVIRKANTNPPNRFIANTEMAAGAGIVLSHMNGELDTEKITAPSDIKELFLEYVENNKNVNLSKTDEIIIEQIRKYPVRKMVNETMDDLKYLIKNNMRQNQG